MSLTIDISPDVEKALREKAHCSGQSPAEFAAALITQAVRLDQKNGSIEHHADIQARLAALERIGSYDTRARAGLPPLSDEAISRDNIYEGRG